MHAALAIPEIVDAILQSFTPMSSSLLYPSLFVNRLFSIQATRLLWGSRASDRRVDSFMRLYRDNPSRAQFYANFIQHLRLRVPESERYVKFTSVQRDEGIRRPELPVGLDWPKLKAIEFEDAAINLRDVQRFLQPSLLSIRIHSVEQICDTLLRCIWTICPKLTQLEITMSEGANDTFSEQAILDLITQCGSLKVINFSNVYRSHSVITWATPVPRALSQLPELQKLSIHRIKMSQWHEIIQEPSKATHETKGLSIFPNLHSLVTTMTLAECRLVFPYLGAIKSLGLDKVQSDIRFQHVLVTVAANLPALTSLSIFMAHGEDESFSGPEIVFLSQNCRGLQSLRLCAPRTHFHHWQEAATIDLNDDMIREVAKNLPGLISLDFNFSGARHLSARCLEFLIENCAGLYNFD